MEWNRFGGYEVSSKGDHRFSALFARLPDGRTIEEHYQCDVKGYDPGGRNWKLGKGKKSLYGDSEALLYLKYLALWKAWAIENPALIQELRKLANEHGGMLCDRFANTACNQARALCDILNEIDMDETLCYN